LRIVLKEVLSHEPRRNPVTSGQGLDPRFSPRMAMLGL
jgi:hypothetical protein